MTLVRLPFQAEWREAVLAGHKTTTTRTRRFGVAGDEFELAGVRFRLVLVDAMPLVRARDTFWREEGMASIGAFEAAWVRNHPTRGWRPADSVWVHRFERADGSAP